MYSLQIQEPNLDRGLMMWFLILGQYGTAGRILSFLKGELKRHRDKQKHDYRGLHGCTHSNRGDKTNPHGYSLFEFIFYEKYKSKDSFHSVSSCQPSAIVKFQGNSYVSW